jgi:hypothetical protein
MMVAERAGVHVWRLAHDIDWLSDEAASLLLHQMIADTRAGPDREIIRRLTEDAQALRRSDPWQRALRVMREFRWSSY